MSYVNWGRKNAVAQSENDDRGPSLPYSDLDCNRLTMGFGAALGMKVRYGRIA